MMMRVKQALLATTMSALVLAPAAAVVTVASADAAFAKSDKAKKDRKPRKERAAKSRGSEKSAGKGKANAPGQLKKQAAAAMAGDSVTAVSTSPRPNTRGKSWKTRLDSGMLQTHPSELGAWNSARRNPNAIANLVEKYRETGEANGAGGMIAALVVAYEDRNAVISSAAADLQAAIDSGVITKEQVEAILSGDLSAESLAQDVTALKDGAGMESGDYVVIENSDGTVSVACFNGDPCDLADATAEADRINGDLAALNQEITPETTLEDGTIVPAKTVADIGDEIEAADATADAADATIVPNKSPDDQTVVDMMIADVLDLLDLTRDELSLMEPEAETEAEGDAI